MTHSFSWNQLFILGFWAAVLGSFTGCSQQTPVSHTSDQPDNPAAKPTQEATTTDTTPPPVTSPTPAPKPGDLNGETKPLFSLDDMSRLDQINKQYEKLASEVLPRVVSLSCSYPEDPSVSELFPFHVHPHHGHPGPANGPANMSFGSGVIISHDGYIVTNHHVVDLANKIEVRLSDHRKFEARLIASDEAVDLAVIKIDCTNLPALPWGDSDKLQIGEQVFAAGNPFNLNDSFTNGIVSAKSRNLNSGTIDDFIQTNAAINPGNSGGALVNIRGELVGVNAAIASSTGVNSGVGFAIPSNLARFAVTSLIKNGHVVRGYLGVRYMPDDVSDDVKDELALDTDEGALVYEVEAGSPAQTAGLKPYDFITSVDGHHISGPASLRLVIAQVPIGKEVGLIYIRDGHSNSTTVKIGMLPSDLISSTDGAPPHNPESTNSPTEPEPANGSNTKATVVTGIKVGDLSPKNRATFKVDPKVKTAGAIVTDVSDGSLAELMDLKPGDIIVNARVSHSPGKEISSADDFNKLAKDIKPGQSVLLLVTRGVESGGLINLSASKMNP